MIANGECENCKGIEVASSDAKSCIKKKVECPEYMAPQDHKCVYDQTKDADQIASDCIYHYC